MGTHPHIYTYSAETPLKGGEAVVLEEGTGFEGHIPKSSRIQTPSALRDSVGGMTPLSSSGGARSVTSSRSALPGGATPMRDQLGLNQAGGLNAEHQQLMVLSEKRRQKAIRAQLADGLEGLPAPQYSYEISVPELDDEDEGNGEKVPMEEDAADRDAREAAKRRAQEEAELERRSTVLKRGLPRPSTVNPEAFKV